MTPATAMSPFRLFGRPSRPVAEEPDPWLDDVPGPARAEPPGRGGTVAPGSYRDAGQGTPDPYRGTAEGTSGPFRDAGGDAGALPGPPGGAVRRGPLAGPDGVPGVTPPTLGTFLPGRHPGAGAAPDPLSGDRAAGPPSNPLSGGRAAGLPPGPHSGGGAAGPPADGPATAAARPSLWTAHRPPQEQPAEPEPVTDPFGFPPVPAADDVAARWAAWAPDPSPTPVDLPAGTPGESPHAEASPGPPAGAVRPGPASPEAPSSDTTRPPRAGEPGGQPDRQPTDPPDGNAIDPADAAALASAFAADLLSWDEDDPARRGRALGAHLPSPEGAALLGWTGTGRQRADLVLPGRVRTDGATVHVEVRVRVVPYRRVGARAPGAPEPEPDPPLGEPAAAPAPSARGWRGLAARWVRIEVAVTRAGDRLVVAAGPGEPSPADLAARAPGRPR